MVDNALLEQLRSRDAAKRKAAVQQLARSKDLAALPYLEALEKKDPDPSVVELARKATIYIKRHAVDDESANLDAKKISAERSESVVTQYRDDPPPPAKPVVSKPPEEVSASRVSRAQTLLNSTLDAQMRGDNVKAIKCLIDAFKLNPNLQRDAYARGLAGTMTGLHTPEAVAAVMDGSAAALFAEEPKKKRDEAGKGQPQVGWGDSVVDLLLYGLVNAAVLGVSIFLIVYVLLAQLPPEALNPANFNASGAVAPVNVAQLADQLALAGTVTLIIYAVVYGLLQIVGLLIQTFLIHVAATMMLGGSGTMPVLIRKLTTLLIIGTPLLTIAQIVILYLSLENPQISLASAPLLLIASAVFFFLYIGRISNTYEFGFGKGCLSVIISSVMLSVIGCGIGYVLFLTYGESLATFMVMTATP